MAHCLVDSDLVLRLSPRSPTQQDFSKLSANTAIETDQFATASRWRLESHACLNEKMTTLDYFRVQFSTWRTISDGGNMHSR